MQNHNYSINSQQQTNTSISTDRQNIEMNPINPMCDNSSNQMPPQNINYNYQFQQSNTVLNQPPQNYQNTQNINYNQQQQQFNQPPQQFQNVDVDPNFQQQQVTGLDQLKIVPGIYIEQKMDILEVLTGWEVENEYKVFSTDLHGNKSSQVPMFIIKEKSDCCQRQCLSGSCRAFELRVYQTGNSPQGVYQQQMVMYASREYQCTFFCANRPVLEVFDSEQKTNQIGHILNPFKCCDVYMKIYNRHNDLKYNLRGDCCQWGFFCKDCPCESCQQMELDLNDELDQPIIKIHKKSAGFVKAALSNADNYSIVFPQNSTVQERALLMASVILVDYQHFEQKKNNNNNHHH